MKLIFTILLFTCLAANANTYYVSNTGNDTHSGASATPFLTIPYAISVASDGDTILIERNGVFRITSTVLITLNRFVIDAYGTGNLPLITGFQTVTGFTNVSGNVWQASTGILHRAINTVTVNGLFAYKARFPNSTFLSYKQALKDTGLKTYLTGDTSYAGAEIVTRPQQIVLNISKVKFQHTDTLSYLPPTLRQPVGQWGFFFQNRQDFIDTVGEYTFDSSTGILSCYSVGTPTVQMSMLDTLILINHKDKVTFRNVMLTGANVYAIKLDTSHNFTFKKSIIDSCGNYGIYASKCRDALVDSSVIINCYNIGIVLGNEFTGVFGITLDTCKRPRITNTTIDKIGIKEGMASANIYQTVSDGETSHVGIWVAADTLYLRNNIFKSIGYAPIRFTGYGDTMMNNYVDTFGFIKPDGGAFYSYLGSPLAHNRDSTTFIYRNIIKNGLSVTGANQGIFQNTIFPAAGLYSDNFTSGVTYKENTIINCAVAGIYSLEASNNTYIGNTSIDSVEGTPVYVIVAGTGLKLRNNIFYQKSSVGFAYRTAIFVTLPDLNSDSNYYYQPTYASKSSILYNGGGYTLSAFKTATGFDTHSTDILPTGYLSTTPLILINPTNSDSTISLTPSYIDARGNYYLQNKITLAPYTSAVLFKIKAISGSKYFYLIH